MMELMYLNTDPNTKFEPYICCNCVKNCGALVNEKYCIKCFKEMKKNKEDNSPF